MTEPILEQISAFADDELSAGACEFLVRRMERDEFDFAAIGRALLADPAWPEKLRSGREAEVVEFTREHLASYP